MDSNITCEKYLNVRNDIKNNDFHPDTCVIKHVLNMLQGKWVSSILFELCVNDVMRYGELKKSLPQITNTMLASTLKELESHQLINRKQFNEIPPHVEYSLTMRGRDLIPIFYEMYLWGEHYITKH